ncbi:MAG: iron complex transport system substrate-binding protein [Glaciecola sp.]|jgi:iron complex transport system substrate-binding protein
MLKAASAFVVPRLAFTRVLKGRGSAFAALLSVIVAALVPLAASGAKTPERVISTDAAITEIVIALGALDRLVGVDDTSEIPVEQSSLPRLGYHRALSAEGLLSLDPDQLLVSEHAGPTRALAPLEAASVPLLRLPSAHDVAGLKSNVRSIAAALAIPKEGESLLGQIDTRAALINTYAPRIAPRAVLLRESNGELRVAGQGSAGNALLVLLGAENVVDYRGYRTFTAEGLLALNPEVLLIADETLPSGAQWLSRYPLLRYSQAAEAQAVISVDSRALVGGLSLTALSEAERILKLMSGTQKVVGP